MRIALFCDAFPVHSQTFVRRQAKDLIEAGVDLDILTFAEGEAWGDAEEAGLLRDRVFVVRPSTRRHARHPGRKSRAREGTHIGGLPRAAAAMLLAAGQGEAEAVKSIAKAWLMEGLGRYDAILAHFGPVGVRVHHLRRAGLVEGPMAVVFHGYDLSIRRVLDRHRRGYPALLSHAELALPVNERWRERLIALGADPSRVRVHRMGVDVPPARDVDFGRPLGSPLRVLSIGRFVAKKGFADAIDAIKAVRSPIELTILGDGELEGALRARAAGREDRIRFGGRRAHAEVLEAIQDADVVLQPSATATDGDTEGIPVVLMEAMSRGTLVLSTRHGGVGELVEHERSGFLVDERRPDQIASILEALSSGAHDIDGIRRAAYEKVSSEFEAGKQAERLMDLLTAIASMS